MAGPANRSPDPSSRPHRGALVAGAILLVVALAAAVSIDVVKTEMGVKGDEATYVAMTLSVAFDHDLVYQRRDLERFWGLYRSGPEGIFLKRGESIHVRFRGSPPYVHVSRVADPQPDRLYFGKAFIYSLVAAPFVRVLGLNGFLVFHVLLLFGVCASAYAFLAARSRPGPALAFALTFVFAAVIPVYAVFLTSDIFNFALVFFAYFLWLYKDAAGRATPGWLSGPGSDVAAAVLLGAATYSKPTHALLIAPIVLSAWWRRRGVRGAVVAVAFVAATGALFGANAWISGEMNYQGGDRKTFYQHFPFENPDATWDRASLGIPMATNDSDAGDVLAPSELANRFGHNVEYFLIGRHFGLLPYFFPSVVAIGLWLASADRVDRAKLVTFLTVGASAVALLLFAPYTWSGGGGPPGNRYFLSLIPPLFFLTPPLDAFWPSLLACVGGALFTAKILVNPFVSAKFPFTIAQHGAARRLPVELTMANDLPIMLDALRSHLAYGQDPGVLLYFLDEHAYPPDPAGIWIAGDGRADIVMRSVDPLDHLHVTVTSPIHTTFTMSGGAGSRTATLAPGVGAALDVPVSGVRGLNSYAYLLSVRSSDAFTPHLRDPASTDFRNLGALMQFQAVTASRR